MPEKRKRLKSVFVSKDDDETAVMTLTMKQLRLVNRALDFHSRMMAGQWSELSNEIRMCYWAGGDGVVDSEAVNGLSRIMDALKAMVFRNLGCNGSMGIGHEDLCEESGAEYEIHKWIDNFLSRNASDQDWSVMKDPPIRVTRQRKVGIEEASEELPDEIQGRLDKLARVASKLSVMLGAKGVAVRICNKCNLPVEEDKLHEHVCGQAEAGLEAEAEAAGDAAAGRGRRKKDHDRVPPGRDGSGGRKGRKHNVPVF